MDEEQASSLHTRSCASRSSQRSRSSATGAAATRARARAEAARARLSFAEKEMQLKLEKAQLEAAMELLTLEKETAAAVAEAEVLEAASDISSEKHSCKLQLDAVPLDPKQRTKEYVVEQASAYEDKHVASQADVLPQDERRQVHVDPTQHHSLCTPHMKAEDGLPSLINRTALDPLPPVDRPKAQNPFHASDSPYAPRHGQDTSQSSPFLHRHVPQNSHSCDSNMTDFVRFLARRELVSTGLLQFNDQPESYRSWQRSFQNAVGGLNLTCSEEMDLLVKWLGKESADHARRIRAIHVKQPEKGLRMIWTRLDECFGSSEAIENALFRKLDSFPKVGNRDFTRLRDLSDLLMELQAAKLEGDLPGLSYLDTPRGVNPVVQKLPYSLQEKWLSFGSNYKEQFQVAFPPFTVFVNFINQQARIRNDPSFSFTGQVDVPSKVDKPPWKQSKNREVSVFKAEFPAAAYSDQDGYKRRTENPERICPIHKRPHTLRKCRAFREKPIEERKAFLKENRICYKCCMSTSHTAKECKLSSKCSECDSEKHPTALHPGPAPWIKETSPDSEHGGEEHISQLSEATTLCTQVCGGDFTERSCSKILLAKVYPTGSRDRAMKVYVILDEQSNRSLACSDFFDVFNVKGPSSLYCLRTCSGVSENMGRRAFGFQIESLDGKVSHPLPGLLECNEIPNNRMEIPTPSAALHHAHLRPIAHLIPELEPKASIMLLLGRDAIRVHKVRKHLNGPQDAPYAQKLELGWVIVGDVCLGSVHKPVTVNTLYTSASEKGHPTIFKPCPNVIHVKERYSPTSPDIQAEVPRMRHTCSKDDSQLGHAVFQVTSKDNYMAPSIEDITFMDIMAQGLRKDESNSWVAPLPFQVPRQRLPDNKAQAQNRLCSLIRSLNRKPEMRQHFFSFMEKIFENDHAEEAPCLKQNEERWYLPIFGVYHPKKPASIRVVFDSSARQNGVSLNDVLLTGPDLNNSLVGVLIRFRKEAVAVTVDIQQMYYCFLVREEDRNFLRFLWFKNNDPNQDITEYRMRVHVFGNRPSPAVAIYCLRQSVKGGEPEVEKFVNRDYYVDDGLTSLTTVEAAVSLVKKTQETLCKSNLRLHKIASNKKEVMEAFPTQDRATDLKDLDLASDTLPEQRSLGLNWDLKSDTFAFKCAEEEKPFTRRGVLSVVNSVYDPLGFVAPVTIEGKSILREFMQGNGDWDATLPKEMENKWISWRNSLKDLRNLHITRTYTRLSPSKAAHRELCVFSDASTKAIAAVVYLKVTDADGNSQVGFVMGKAKLTPRPEHTIPRLELCAAVLAVELAELVSAEIDVQLDTTTFYTDSKVVLGYIYNETRRFYVYVSNRVIRIRTSSRPEQWRYVSTDQNPADCATRSVTAAQLLGTTWLCGPAFLTCPDRDNTEKETFELINPAIDADVRPQVSTLNTQAMTTQLGSQRFSKFSTWKSLNHAIAHLGHIAYCFHEGQANKCKSCEGWHLCEKAYTAEQLLQAKYTIIRSVQEEAYAQEFACIRRNEKIPQNSSLKTLDPFIDAHGLLRVGGRISEAQLEQDEKNPLLIPGKHHVATLLIRHYHQQTSHQGRLFTEGAIRAAGLWIVGVKRRVSSVIHHCVICRKLRGVPQTQKMANLPPDRLSMEPPFTNVGLDVFGPWSIASRRTRGGLAHSKRWAVMFTCMAVRAVHIEVIESLDTSSFINALRRFLAIRGPVKLIRSDRGTNFVSASKELNILSNIDSGSVSRYLADHGCSWNFNPPHAPHMGGSWERMIGMAKKILDTMFLQLGPTKLTHEVLTTLMAEVSAIINARPLVPVSTDPKDPIILTPAMLLTQKESISSAPPGDFGDRTLFRHQWRQVQHLAQTFWDRWRKQYISTLQPRRKWQDSQQSMELGSIVLLRDDQLKRNEWPLGLVTQVFPSQDGKVRKVEIKVSRRGGTKLLMRPISEIVLVLPPRMDD